MKFVFQSLSVSMLLASFTGSAIAGSGSGAGPGAPQVEFVCRDAGNNVHVMVGKWWPEYKEQFYVNTASETIADLIMKRTVEPGEGGNLLIYGKRFQVSVAATSPYFANGKTYVSAFFKDLDDQVGSTTLECQLVQPNE